MTKGTKFFEYLMFLKVELVFLYRFKIFTFETAGGCHFGNGSVLLPITSHFIFDTRPSPIHTFFATKPAVIHSSERISSRKSLLCDIIILLMSFWPSVIRYQSSLGSVLSFVNWERKWLNQMRPSSVDFLVQLVWGKSDRHLSMTSVPLDMRLERERYDLFNSCVF